MSVVLPQLRVGEPQCYHNLTVFPLFTDTAGGVEYRLADEAMSDKSLIVEEVDEGGSVPNLLVENKGHTRVLFLEGEELVGAKQNRVLNTSVLVGAHTKIRIPVSCVEQGRWRYKSRSFGSSGSHSPSSLRRIVKQAVSQSLAQGHGHRSDQGKVWREVSCMHAAFNVDSSSAAMSDAFDQYQDQINQFRSHVHYVDGAVGFAVAIAGQVTSVDVFDKASTCQRIWKRYLTGLAFDAMSAAESEQHASAADVAKLLATAGQLTWKQTDAVGDGCEYRAVSPQGDHASALACEDRLVHGSLITAE